MTDFPAHTPSPDTTADALRIGSVPSETDEVNGDERVPLRPPIAKSAASAVWLAECIELPFDTVGHASRTIHPAWATLQLETPVTLGQGERLVVRLEHSARDRGLNLGRFRLSVSADATVLAEPLPAALQESGLRGFVALGAAHFCRGDFARALPPLTRAAALPDAGATELLLLALAHH